MQHGGIDHDGLDAQMVDLRPMGRLSVIASDHMDAGSLRSDADRFHRSRSPRAVTAWRYNGEAAV
jgi:hypothetical protein